MVEIQSKHGIVSRAPYEMYNILEDPRKLYQMMPEGKREAAIVDRDTIKATVQGFNIGIKYVERQAYSLLKLQDDDAPFHFIIDIHFDSLEDTTKTDFYINIQADLNFMMKTFLGNRIKEVLDMIVDKLVELSNSNVG